MLQSWTGVGLVFFHVDRPVANLPATTTTTGADWGISRSYVLPGQRLRSLVITRIDGFPDPLVLENTPKFIATI